MKSKITKTELLNSQFGLFFLGGIGFIIKHKDKYIMIDGYLSDYVDKNCCTELVKWVRNYPAPISPDELDFIDYVFCTHSHYDHADPETLSVLAKINKKAKFFASKPITDIIAQYGIERERIVGLETDVKYEICDWFSVTAIPAAHEQIHKAADGNCLEVGFILDIDGKRFFHSGDCCPYLGLEERIKGTDVLILPVNGRDYYRTNILDIIGCFDSREAVTLAKNIGAGLLIPVHIGLYDVNTASEAGFVDAIKTIAPYQPFHMFTPGEKYIID